MSARWFNVPTADILPRVMGDYNYGLGRDVKNSPHLMKFWRDFASYPFQSHDQWFLTENMRWGKLDPKLDTRADQEGQSRGSLARRAKTLGVAAAEIPASPRAARKPSSTARSSIRQSPAAYLSSLEIKHLALTSRPTTMETMDE